MPSVIQAICPGCKQVLHIPSDLTKTLLRCKHCGQIIRATPKAVPVAAAAAQAPTPPAAQPSASIPLAQPIAPANDNPWDGMPLAGEPANPFLAGLRRRRRQRLFIKLGLFVLLVAGLGIAGYIYQDELTGVYDRAAAELTKGTKQGEEVAAAEPKAPERPREIKPATDVPGKPTVKPEPARKPPPRAAGTFPRRALLIGVKNYLYANPLNPGFRLEGIRENDPLGLRGLRQTLTTSLKFPRNQVAELSDVAGTEPYPPLKEAVEETVKQFLQTSRPQDRIVLLFVGHAVELEGKGYLVPLEAELDQTKGLIPIDWLYQQLSACKARQKLLILDLAHLDPEQGSTRKGGGPLGAKIEKQLEEDRPKGVEVWLSCVAGQHSYEFASSNLNGSAFLYYLNSFCKDLAQPAERKALEKKLDLPDGALAGGPDTPLPLVLVAPEVNRKVTDYLKSRWGAEQTPKLLGKELPDGPDPTPDDPTPPPVTVQIPKSGDTLADAKQVEGITREIGVTDPLPPFFSKALEPYKADYATEGEFKAKLGQSELRQATVKAAELLRKHDRSFSMAFKYPGEDNRFKKEIMAQQETAAETYAVLSEQLDKLDSVAKMRAKEPSKRWQAHYDYIYARLLAKLASTQEWNFILGQMRKETPERKNKESTGWNLIPQDKLQQKETREMEKKRQETLDRILKEHPGTPWQLLARRDKEAAIGLKVQEAKIP